MSDVAIYGASGFGKEVAWLAESCGCRVVCFVDDDPSKSDTTLNDIPILTLEAAWARFGAVGIVGGVGDPHLRQKMMQKAAAAGFAPHTLVHPRTEMSRWVTLGAGVVICAGNILTTNIHLGAGVQINLDCTIGHDVTMGDYTSLAPGCHISGCVQIGARVYIGTGAVILNGTQSEPIIIGDDVVIGAAACVTKSVAAGQTVVGVPAKPLVRG